MKVIRRARHSLPGGWSSSITYPVSAGRELLLSGGRVGGGLLGRQSRGGVRAVRGGHVARHVDPGAGRRVRRVHLQQRHLLVLSFRGCEVDYETIPNTAIA